MDLKPFSDFIKEKTGLFFTKNQEGRLMDGIAEIMSGMGIHDPCEFMDILDGDSDVFTELIRLITITETYFYREPVHFHMAAKKFIPEFINKYGEKKKIHILSAGCSTGAEPYSLAIELVETHGPEIARSISVTGLDINPDAIKKAREGVYNKYVLRSMNENLVNRYFDRVDQNKFKIKDHIKNMVEFYNTNLLDDKCMKGYEGADIIFFRNVSIYFNPEKRTMILSRFCNLLNDEGFIIMSSTENLQNDISMLQPVNIEGLFYYIKRTEPFSLLEIGSDYAYKEKIKKNKTITRPDAFENKHIKKKEHSEIGPSKAKFDEVLLLYKQKKYQEALPLLDVIAGEESYSVKAWVLKANIMINNQDLKEARTLCLAVLEKDPLNMEGYFLSGIISKLEENISEAKTFFKKALYVDSLFWPSHFYLGEIYALLEEKKLAYKEFGIVARLLKNRAGVNGETLLFSPHFFTTDQVIQLCEKKMENLYRS